MIRNVTIIALTTFALTSATSAEITGVNYHGRYVDAVDGFGAPDFSGYVIDLWLESNDATDTVLNTFNERHIENSLGAESYYQSFTGGTWLPNNLGPPFETEALKSRKRTHHARRLVRLDGWTRRQSRLVTPNVHEWRHRPDERGQRYWS